MVATELDLLDDPLFIASEVRAQGLSWQAAASEVNTAIGTNLDSRSLRRMAYADTKHWRKLMRDADRTVMSEAGHEAQRVLRLLMRDEKDVKVRLKAAEIHFKIWSALLRHTPKKDRSKPADPYASPWEDDLSEDDHANLLRYTLADYDARIAKKNAGGGDPPEEADPDRPEPEPPRDPKLAAP